MQSCKKRNNLIRNKTPAYGIVKTQTISNTLMWVILLCCRCVTWDCCAKGRILKTSYDVDKHQTGSKDTHKRFSRTSHGRKIMLSWVGASVSFLGLGFVQKPDNSQGSQLPFLYTLPCINPFPIVLTSDDRIPPIIHTY